MRRVSIVVAMMIAAVAGGLLPAAPAQAAPPELEGYILISAYGDTFPGWFWVDEMEGIIGCPMCLHWFDFAKSRELRAEQEASLTGGIMGGLAKLSEAMVAPDPRTRAALRAEALNRFTSAARALEAASLRTGRVGYYDPESDRTVVTSAGWLTAADQDIVDGITLLQRSLTDPSPQPWLEAAIEQFDAAYEELSTKRVIG